MTQQALAAPGNRQDEGKPSWGRETGGGGAARRFVSTCQSCTPSFNCPDLQERSELRRDYEDVKKEADAQRAAAQGARPRPEAAAKDEGGSVGV